MLGQFRFVLKGDGVGNAVRAPNVPNGSWKILNPTVPNSDPETVPERMCLETRKAKP